MQCEELNNLAKSSRSHVGSLGILEKTFVNFLLCLSHKKHPAAETFADRQIYFVFLLDLS